MDRLEMLEGIKRTPDALALIEALKRLPDAIEAETAGLTEDALRRRAAEGEWSINEVVGHLRDNAALWSKRLYMVFSQSDPVLPGIDPDALVREKGYQDADLRSVIAGIREDRMTMVELLEHAPDWSRIGQHEIYGRRSMRQLAEMALEHDEEHLGQIRAMRA